MNTVSNEILSRINLERENQALKAKIKNLSEQNDELNEIVNNLLRDGFKLAEQVSELKKENRELETEIESLKDYIDRIEGDCIETCDLVEKLKKLIYSNSNEININYIAISFDLEHCIPLSAETPLEASQELYNICISRGYSANGFKIFEKSDLG